MVKVVLINGVAPYDIMDNGFYPYFVNKKAAIKVCKQRLLTKKINLCKLDVVVV